MANTTEELAVALKEQDILAVLDTIIDPKVLPQAGRDKVALIDGTTAVNFDEIILDGDRATVSDIDDPNAAPATLERFVSIAGLRHGLTQFGKVMGTTYEHLLGKPTKDDQILSSKKDGTRSWIDAPSGGGGTQGPKGDDGDSAYQVWLDNGNTGNEGEFLQDLIGPDGADGIGVQIKSSKTLAEIQAINGKLGDIYISTDAPQAGHGWVSDGKTGASSWADFGMFQGPKGDTGITTPADQAKLDHITVEQDINLDSDFVKAAADVKDALVEIEGKATSEIVGLALIDQKDGDSIDLVHNSLHGGFMVVKTHKLGTENLLEVTDTTFKYKDTSIVMLPALPTADGDYKLNIAAGVATWVTV